MNARNIMATFLLIEPFRVEHHAPYIGLKKRYVIQGLANDCALVLCHYSLLVPWETVAAISWVANLAEELRNFFLLTDLSFRQPSYQAYLEQRARYTDVVQI